MRKALVALRSSVLTAAGERGIDDFAFPLFDAALFLYKYKQGLAKSDDDPAQVSSWLDEHPKTGQAINILALVLPGVDVAAGVLDTAISEFSRKRAQKWRGELAELNEAEPMEILQKLPYYFALDLSDNMAGRKEPLVIFLDTYEALVDPLSGAAAYKSADLWLRDTAGGNSLICNAVGVLWVILGRNKLTWAESNPDWEGSLETHLLNFLAQEDSASFLSSAGIADRELQRRLAELSGGFPLYLDLCVNIFEHLTAQGRTPTIADFGSDREQLVDRLLRYMDHTSVNLVYRLACLSSWDSALLGELFSQQERTIYEGAIRDLSFLSCEDGVYTIHKIIRDLLLDSRECTRELKNKVWEQVEGYYRKVLEGLTVKDDRYDAAFTAFAEYGIQRCDKVESLTSFYTEELEGRLAALTDLCKTDPVLQCVQDLLAHPAMSSPLLEKVDCQYAEACVKAGQYQQALEYAQRAVDLAVTGRGENDPFSLLAMQALSNAYYHLGRYQQSLALSEKILARHAAILGEEHPDTLKTMGNLAVLYAGQGRYQEAMELEEKVLEHRANLLGIDHPDTLLLMGYLARAYSALGREQEAQALRDKRKSLRRSQPTQEGAK